MKIIRKKMHRRPKKHRPSDINRNNRNLNRCITKVENAPPQYTIVSAEGIDCNIGFIFLSSCGNLYAIV
ncbi:hypothetical protein EON65_38075 [archaeon]|nr:MAG: hypothetical protein EON65_38075 [archaeon]